MSSRKNTAPDAGADNTDRALDILIVDGSRDFRALMRSMLAAYGVRAIDEAETAAQALKRLGSCEIDIIFTEILLPDSNGIALIGAIRSDTGLASQAAPIVCVSADCRRRIVKQAVEAGADAFLAKPVRPIDLHRQIRVQTSTPLPRLQIGRYFGPDRRRCFIDTYLGIERRTAVEVVET